MYLKPTRKSALNYYGKKFDSYLFVYSFNYSYAKGDFERPEDKDTIRGKEVHVTEERWITFRSGRWKERQF